MAPSISVATFPKQGIWLGKIVKVCFNFDTDNILLGEVVRDDMEEPGKMIIKLTNGRYVLSTECQWTPL